MLGERLRSGGANVWLVNTGWSGGGYGVGSRMKLWYTRAMIAAALDGTLGRADFTEDPVFGLSVPTEVPHVPAGVLSPRDTWADPAAYDAAAEKLAGMFKKNFEQFAADVSEEIRLAGPR
jgi:phosphoenolpyruvate carboxykinase (ATP)